MGKLIDEQVHFSQSLAAVSQIEKLSQKRGKNIVNERFKVTPDTYYPNSYLNRNELRQEMNMKSVNYQDLRRSRKKDEEIGQLWVEVLQCFGLPTVSAFRAVSAYAIGVCGSNAFKTDIMPPVANPMWLCKMQRAGVFPLSKAYQRLFVGVFDNGATETNYEFIGRVVVDISRLRPGCVYDVTLPLRQSAHVFSREPRGAVRLRLHLHWDSERAAVTSYIPREYPKFSPNENHRIHCIDEKGFRNIAQVVHGKDMPGKFSLTLLKGTVREFNFMRIHYFRYLRKRELYNLRYWVYPFISGFVFLAWMHAVYANTVRYVPAHIVTFLLLHLCKNYVHYGMNRGEGFVAPSMEELFLALLYGKEGNPQRYIEPLNMERDEHQHTINPGLQTMQFDPTDDYEEEHEDLLNDTNGIPIHQIAEHMRQTLAVQDYKTWTKTYKDCFMGTKAVDFLLTFGYARSREEAVVLGKRLATETKLFEHISQKFDFEEEHHYQFLEYDSRTYVITGRRPRGERFFRLIGFLKDEDRRPNHVEFPFATEQDHPRFSVEQSLVIRSGEAKKEQVQREKKRADSMDSADFESEHAEAKPTLDPTPTFTFDSLFRSLSPPSSPERGMQRTSASRKARSAEDGWKNHVQVNPRLKRASTGAVTVVKTGLKRAQHLLKIQESEEEKARAMDKSSMSVWSLFDGQNSYGNNGDVVDVKNRQTEQFVIEEMTLVEPPPQDVNEKVQGNQGSSFTKTVSDARYQMHNTFGHAFNDSVFKIDTNLYPQTHEPEEESNHFVKESIRLPSRRDTTDKKTPYQIKMDENNRILQIQKYSHSNQWISRIGGVIQPMVETLQVGLYLGRALFNIFTWQDPILSFWLAIFGSVLVVLLYATPFRIVFGVTGMVLVGPQNWGMRIYQEQQPGYQPPDFNKIIKKKRLPSQEWVESERFGADGSIFSSNSPGGNMHGFVDPKQLRSVVVPCSALKYNRFYEWPPEAEYTRVYEASPEDLVDLQRRDHAGLLPSIIETDESSSVQATTHRAFAARPTGPVRNALSPKRFRERIGAIRKKRKKKKNSVPPVHMTIDDDLYTSSRNKIETKQPWWGMGKQKGKYSR